MTLSDLELPLSHPKPTTSMSSVTIKSVLHKGESNSVVLIEKRIMPLCFSLPTLISLVVLASFIILLVAEHFMTTRSHHSQQLQNALSKQQLPILPFHIQHDSWGNEEGQFSFHELNYVSLSTNREQEWSYLQQENRSSVELSPLLHRLHYWRSKRARVDFTSTFSTWPAHSFDAALYTPVVLDFENMWHAVMDHALFVYSTLHTYLEKGQKLALLFHTHECCSYRTYMCHEKLSIMNDCFNSKQSAVQFFIALADGPQNIIWVQQQKPEQYYFKKLFLGMDVSCRSIGYRPPQKEQRLQCVHFAFNMASHVMKYYHIIENDRERFWNTSLQDNHEPYNVVYLSRKGAQHKVVVNEDEILHHLNQSLPHNARLSVVHFEHMTLQEQMETLHHARVFIAGRGAGMTNTIFLRRGSTYVHMCDDMMPFSSFSETKEMNWLEYRTVRIEVVCDIRKQKDIQCESNWNNWKVYPGLNSLIRLPNGDSYK